MARLKKTFLATLTLLMIGSSALADPSSRRFTLFSDNRVMALPEIDTNKPVVSRAGLRHKERVSFSKKSLINPVVGQKELTLVHTPGHEHTGGFFGPNVRGRRHLGIDIQAKVGTPVQASGHGKIHRVGFDRRGYGNFVIIRHKTAGGKIFETRYAHLSKVFAKTGTTVLQGDVIGLSGRTGNARRSSVLPHVHFEYREVLKGKAVALNPLPRLVKTVPPRLKNYFAKEGLTLNNE